MDDTASGDLLRAFDSLPDPRAHNVVHPMQNILLIAIMAVTCGASDWQAVNRWADIKRAWLATFLDLSCGLPSRDTFRRFFAALDPQAFERCFLIWTTELVHTTMGRLIAIDGKTLRRSGHGASQTKARHCGLRWTLPWAAPRSRISFARMTP